MKIQKDTFRKAVWQAMAIVALGCFAGLLANFLRPGGLNLVKANSANQASDPGDSNGLQIALEDAEIFFLSQTAIFLDTRDGEAYDLGHIQGAKSLPWGEFEVNYQAVLEDIEKDVYIITYCDGAKCNSSEHVAVALLEKGFSNVYVLFNGWTLWQKRDLPVDKGTG